jgi:enoyl-CoA hydratase/carnithine racemase
MSAEEGLAWGYFNGVVPKDKVLSTAQDMARTLAGGPAFAHAMTKKCLHQEWNQSIEQALETEAEAQAICMQTQDFERAYNAFVAKQKPKFEGD